MIDLGFRTVERGGGDAVVECDVTAATANALGTLHGGVIATLVDEAGTEAIRSTDRDGRRGVTTDLNVSYFAAAPVGTTVRAEARTLKIGKTLAFVEVDLRGEGGKLLAQGRMTKYMPA
ncbi:MAG: PaaI family thioesterase [Myxococcota bacterium]